MVQQFNSFRELIEHQSRLDKVFLIEPVTGQEILYSEMLPAIRTVSEKLKSLGLRRGSRVAVALPNSPAAVAALLGILYSDAVVVPVNPGWKAGEFEYILEDSDAGFLITTDEVLEDAGVCLKPGGAQCTVSFPASGGIRLFRLQEYPEEESDLALLLYTSGTTGRPKGVMLSFRNLMAETGYIRDGHRLTEEDISLLVLPMFHINGLVIGFLTPYTLGCTLVIPPRFSVSRFWEWVERYRISWVSAVPTIISLLLAKTPETYRGAASLRFMRSASAPLPVAVLREFEERFRIPIVESFGISEGGSQITTNPVDGIRKPGSAGKAAGNQVTVADDHGNELPSGKTGEIRVRGDNIFSGYYKKPEETAKVLRGGWFYTGDLGWIDEDGYIFLKGRKKELINRAGEKFSPREIDEVLYRIPGVELAAAVGVPDRLYNEEVVAYIRLRDGVSLSAEDIIEACRGKIADFKLPKEVFFTDDFPKGPSGKIQRLKLVDRYLGKH